MAHNADLYCTIVALGAWGPGFEDWAELQGAIIGSASKKAAPVCAKPTPAIMPANERRRAPLPVSLAVETSWQAVESAGIAADNLACVFASGLGDTQLTDYLCSTLASEHKALSPTKFHNSVHNAPAGYWTIATQSMRAANSLCGFEHSASLALLEAMVQCQQEQTPVLLTCYDVPVAEKLGEMLKNTMPFSFSMIITPHAANATGVNMSARITSEACVWPELESNNANLIALYQNNPAARILSLAQRLSVMPLNSGGRHGDSRTLIMPLNAGSSLAIRLV